MTEISYTQEQLTEAYDKLPTLVREAISRIGTLNTIRSIKNKYGLHIDQTGELADSIGLVLFGLSTPESFVGNIQRKLYLTSEQANDIAQTVNREIFVRVQELVKELSSAEGTTPTPSNTPTSPPPKADDGPTDGIFEQKMAKMFSWDTDPYLEHPDKA